MRTHARTHARARAHTHTCAYALVGDCTWLGENQGIGYHQRLRITNMSYMARFRVIITITITIRALYWQMVTLNDHQSL